MTTSTTFDKVRASLIGFFAPSDLTPESLLYEHCGLDSLDLTELMMELGDIFKIEDLEDHYSQHLVTVQDLVNLIDSKRPDADAANTAKPS